MRIPNTNEDILASSTMRAIPRAVDYGKASFTEYTQALDNFHRIFAIRTGEHVVMLTDPLLDPRVVQAVQGVCKARGATFISYMGESTRYTEVPAEARALLERADFVVSTWFASVFDPFCINLRKTKGQRWIKITFFRNVDLWNTPQARYPVDIVGALVRGTARLYPENGPFEMHITDKRGTDFRVPFSAAMRDQMKRDNRWRGQYYADQPGCYVHYMATHGPNIYDPIMHGNDPNYKVGLNGVIYAQWGVGFESRSGSRRASSSRTTRWSASTATAKKPIFSDSFSSAARWRSWAAATCPRRRASTSIPPAPIRRARCTSASTACAKASSSAVSCRTGKSRTCTWIS